MDFDTSTITKASHMVASQPSSAGMEGMTPGTLRPLNMRDRIEIAVQQAEVKLKDVRRAREIFEKHPDLEELLNIMQRSHF